MADFLPSEVRDGWLNRENAEFMGWLRVCPECERRNDWLMRDGSWVCHSCGRVEFPDEGSKGDE